jgi:hypothetical protein
MTIFSNLLVTEMRNDEIVAFNQLRKRKIDVTVSISWGRKKRE